MSPDEKLKQVTMVSMLLKIGVPAEEVVPLLPFDPKDTKALENSINLSIEESSQLTSAP
jgi:hypothetical protein